MNTPDVVYQVYPRSFQDSDGTGEGDLRGIASRLDHLAWLGVDALWLSPMYPSPMADGGYDVADYEAVDPRFGTLEDADALIAAAHDRGLKILFDAVPCHTSIEHRWFREHPERYVWSPVDGPPNNWIAAFGGSAWSRDGRSGRWYLHSFYPEQPDLDWRRDDVPEAFGDGLRFWLGRGVDGFRVDAIDRLMKDPQLRDDPPAQSEAALPLDPDHGTLEHLHSRNAPDIGVGLAKLRAAVGDATLVGEAYVPTPELGPYLEYLDLCFGFELFHADWEAARLRAAIDAAAAIGSKRVAWVLSNHDFSRLPNRVGEQHVRAAALLLLTLPGTAFIFQGDEIGMENGPGREPPDDRHGRDVVRHPMAWDDALPHAGFTIGEPWLPATGAPGGAVAAQREDSTSMLHLYRDLIALRRSLRGPVEPVEAADGVVAHRRGEHLIALNVAGEPRPAPPARELLRHTHGAVELPPELGPGEGFVAHA